MKTGARDDRRNRGRVGIITGASSGIGRAIAHRLSASGASLCLLAAPEDEAAAADLVSELTAAGGGAVYLAADVGDPETAARTIDMTLQRFGRLDFLASNAGIAHSGDALSAPLEDFDHTMRVNVRGMYLMCIAAARAMAGDSGGAIVCTASTASFAGQEHDVTYNTSKGAVVALVRSLAVDLARHGIRVNAVAPGWVRTRLTEETLANPGEWAKHRSRVPLDRAAEADEIAAVVAFLLSDDASYMTGSVVVADGGLTAGFRASDWEAVRQPLEPRTRRRIQG